MTQLAQWLAAQMQARGYTQIEASVYTSVSQGTLSDILQKGHMPRIETLFRLADHFGTSRVEILLLTGHLQPADTLPHALHPDPDIAVALTGTGATQPADQVTQELIQQFRQVPDEWKQELLTLIRTFVRLANRLPAATEEAEEPPSAQQPSDQVPAQVP